MSRHNDQNNNYNGNQYYGNGQYYGNNNQYYNQNGQYYNQNGQYNQNRQYYNSKNKFGLYDQPPQYNNNKKKIDTELLAKIGIFAGFAIILILIVFAINSCGKKEACPSDYRQVGQELYGYACVPSDWVNFVDETKSKDSTLIQYSAANPVYVLAMDYFDKNPSISLKSYANAYEEEIKGKGFSTQNIEEKLDGRKAYQILAHNSETNVWIISYFLESDDGRIHYIGVEGPSNLTDEFEIPKSYKLKK